MVARVGGGEEKLERARGWEEGGQEEGEQEEEEEEEEGEEAVSKTANLDTCAAWGADS